MSGMAEVSEQDKQANHQLQNAVNDLPNKTDVKTVWPAVSEIPVNEFGDVWIFTRAFPWLFPGGIGDPKVFEGHVSDWGEMMLFYEDGRFAKDPIFPFYAMNYVIRQRNSSSGSFFIDKFHSGCPHSLEELKKSIQNGDTKFVNNLTYYNKRVYGSTSYWHHKRAELYAWLNHHIEVGHGPPSYFITLSCAEYYWKEIVDIIKD